jgi:hypothetical protein
MPVKSVEPLRRHTLNLYDGDMEELRQLFPKEEPTILIRELVHDLIRRIKSQDPEIPRLDIKVEL